MTRPLRTVMLAALLSAGCGGASSSPSGPAPTATATPAPTLSPSIKPCALLTTAEAQTALGEPVQPPQASTAGGVSGCVWAASPPAPASDLVIVSADTRAALDSIEKAGNAGGIPITKVPGVGDDAVVFGTGATAVLEARRGGVVINVEVVRGGVALQDQEIALAHAALARLPQ